MTSALSRSQPSNGPVSRGSLDRLFEESFVRPLSRFGVANSMNHLPLDLLENDDSFVVRAVVPGVTADNLDITAQGKTLTIRARQSVEQQEGVHYLLKERVGNEWFRILELPSAFDADNVEAKLEYGILYLTLPKTPESRPQRILINPNA